MNVMGNKILGVSNMVICDLCKRNKAIRKITYPMISPVEYVAQFHGVDYSRTVNGCKIEDRKYDVCQKCWYMLVMNRDNVFRMTKEMIYNKVNESEGNEK